MDETFLAESTTDQLIQSAKINVQAAMESESFFNPRGAAYARLRRVEKVLLEMDRRNRQGRLEL